MRDALMRISMIIGIYKALHTYFGQPWADQWVTLANRNSMFAAAPIPLHASARPTGMMQVRRVLDGRHSGN